MPRYKSTPFDDYHGRYEAWFQRHPEVYHSELLAVRAFLPWQAHWLPEDMKELEASPWLKMFSNAYEWCVK